MDDTHYPCLNHALISELCCIIFSLWTSVFTLRWTYLHCQEWRKDIARGTQTNILASSSSFMRALWKSSWNAGSVLGHLSWPTTQIKCQPPCVVLFLVWSNALLTEASVSRLCSPKLGLLPALWGSGATCTQWKKTSQESPWREQKIWPGDKFPKSWSFFKSSSCSSTTKRQYKDCYPWASL